VPAEKIRALLTFHFGLGKDCSMCAGDDHNCPQFDLHRQELLDSLDRKRRSFLKGAFVATSGAAALTLSAQLEPPSTDAAPN
jgi:hypothetical protein